MKGAWLLREVEESIRPWFKKGLKVRGQLFRAEKGGPWTAPRQYANLVSM